jgi:hypothetical protein
MGFEPMMRVLQTLALATWPRRHFDPKILNRGLMIDGPMQSIGNHQSTILNHESGRWDSNPRPSPWQGDVLPLYYARKWPDFQAECREPGSDWRHRNFQSRALPTELSRPRNSPSLKRKDFTRREEDCQAKVKIVFTIILHSGHALIT